MLHDYHMYIEDYLEERPSPIYDPNPYNPFGYGDGESSGFEDDGEYWSDGGV